MTVNLSKGSIIRCEQADDMQKPFLGKIIEHIHQRIILQIINFYPVDRYMVKVLEGQIVVSEDQVRPVRMIKVGATKKRSQI